MKILLGEEQEQTPPDSAYDEYGKRLKAHLERVQIPTEDKSKIWRAATDSTVRGNAFADILNTTTLSNQDKHQLWDLRFGDPIVAPAPATWKDSLSQWWANGRTEYEKANPPPVDRTPKPPIQAPVAPPRATILPPPNLAPDGAFGLTKAEGIGDPNLRLGQLRSKLDGLFRNFAGVLASDPLKGAGIAEQFASGHFRPPSFGDTIGTRMAEAEYQSREGNADFGKNPDLNPTVNKEDTVAWKLGTGLTDFLTKTFPTNPKFAADFSTTVVEGAGGMAGFMALGGIGAVTKLPTLLTVMLGGAMSQGVQGYEEAEAAQKKLGKGKVSDRDVLNAWLLGSAIGTSEALPVERAIERFDHVTGGMLSRWIRNKVLAGAVNGSMEEFIQEFGQQLAGNIVAKDIVGFDPERSRMEGVGTAASAGGILGAAMSGLMGVAGLSGQKQRAAREELIRRIDRNTNKLDEAIQQWKDRGGGDTVIEAMGKKPIPLAGTTIEPTQFHSQNANPRLAAQDRSVELDRPVDEPVERPTASGAIDDLIAGAKTPGVKQLPPEESSSLLPPPPSFQSRFEIPLREAGLLDDTEPWSTPDASPVDPITQRYAAAQARRAASRETSRRKFRTPPPEEGPAQQGSIQPREAVLEIYGITSTGPEQEAAIQNLLANNIIGSRYAGGSRGIVYQILRLPDDYNAPPEAEELPDVVGTTQTAGGLADIFGVPSVSDSGHVPAVKELIDGGFIEQDGADMSGPLYKILKVPDIPVRPRKPAEESVKKETPAPPEGRDELYDEAAGVVAETGKAYPLVLQERLKVGYGRAVALLEELERAGVTGPQHLGFTSRIPRTPEQEKQQGKPQEVPQTEEPGDEAVTPPPMVTKKPLDPEPARVISVGPDAGTWELIAEDVWQNVTDWEQNKKWRTKTTKELDVWALITQPPPRFRPRTRFIGTGPMAGTWVEVAYGFWRDAEAPQGSGRMVTTEELDSDASPEAPDEPPAPVTPPPVVKGPAGGKPGEKKELSRFKVFSGPLAGDWISMGDDLWEHPETKQRASTNELAASENTEAPKVPIVTPPPAPPAPRYTVEARPDGKFDVIRPNGKTMPGRPFETREKAEAEAAARNKVKDEATGKETTPAVEAKTEEKAQLGKDELIAKSHAVIKARDDEYRATSKAKSLPPASTEAPELIVEKNTRDVYRPLRWTTGRNVDAGLVLLETILLNGERSESTGSRVEKLANIETLFEQLTPPPPAETKKPGKKKERTPPPKTEPPAPPAKRWKYEVIADNTGKWYGNSVTFATKAEAEQAAQEKTNSWFAVREWRVVETEEEKPAEPPVAPKRTPPPTTGKPERKAPPAPPAPPAPAPGGKPSTKDVVSSGFKGRSDEERKQDADAWGGDPGSSPISQMARRWVDRLRGIFGGGYNNPRAAVNMQIAESALAELFAATEGDDGTGTVMLRNALSRATQDGKVSIPNGALSALYGIIADKLLPAWNAEGASSGNYAWSAMGNNLRDVVYREILDLYDRQVEAAPLAGTHRVVDTADILDPAYLKELAERPYMKPVADMMASATDRIFEAINKATGGTLGTYWFGVGVDSGYYGVNVNGPSVRHANNLLMINPYAIMEVVEGWIRDGHIAHEDRAFEFAQQVIKTAIHEATHQVEGPHGPLFDLIELNHNAHITTILHALVQDVQGMLEANGHEFFEAIRNDLPKLQARWEGVGSSAFVGSRFAAPPSTRPGDDSSAPGRHEKGRSGSREDIQSGTQTPPSAMATRSELGDGDEGEDLSVSELPPKMEVALLRQGSEQFRFTPGWDEWSAAMLAWQPKTKPYLRSAHAIIEDIVEELQLQTLGVAGGTNAGTTEGSKGEAEAVSDRHDGSDTGGQPSEGVSDADGVGGSGEGSAGTGGAGSDDVSAGEGAGPEPGTDGGAGSQSGDVGGGGGDAAGGSGAVGGGGLAEPPHAAPKNAGFFRIDDQHKIGVGSEKVKFDDNIAALKVLIELRKTGRLPTEQEKATLARYVGWGGLSQYAIKVDGPGYKTLRPLLSHEEFAAASRSTINAHYTSIPVVKFLWNIAAKLGFKGGSIVEPSFGIGNFFGAAPASIVANSDFMGVELDKISAEIAGHLYPEATVYRRGFQDVIIPDNSVDLFIGNVPFSREDKPYDPRYTHLNLSIHNYFMVRALDKAAPGGAVIFITSHYTMDSKSSKTRDLLAARGDLIAAYRLPNDAFLGNARTSVTTDVLVFRKRAPGEERGGSAFMNISPLTPELNINEYFIAHPENMFGRMSLEGKMHARKPGVGEPTLSPTGPLEPQLEKALAKLTGTPFAALTRPPGNPKAASALAQFSPDDIKEFGYTVDENGDIKQRREGILVDPDVKALKTGSVESRAKAEEQMRGLIKIREALKALIRVQMESDSEEALGAAQTELNVLYDAYVAKHGPLRDKASRSVFKDDPQYPLLRSLEEVDSETKDVTKADIFSMRTIKRWQPLLAVSDDPKEALLQVLGQSGYADVDLLAELSHRPVADVIKDLVAQELIFRDPETGRYETSEAYLSGDVRSKFEIAEKAATQSPDYVRNLAALKAAQPATISIQDADYGILPKLGATWISPEIHAAFIRNLLGRWSEESVHVTYYEEDGRWHIEGNTATWDSVKNTNEWAGGGVTALELIETALNQKRPTVYDPHAKGERAVVNVTKTEAARDVQDKIKDEFVTWVRASEWAEPLEKEYNKRFNRFRDQKYDGSHLVLPGMSENTRLRPHQLSVIWRIITQGRALMAHEVGAGKTMAAIAAGMEMKRLGLVNKPMYAVPKNLIENGQWAKEFYALYPAANLLIATSDDFSPQNRQTLMSRIATGNWDAIIIGHTTLDHMPMGGKYVAKTIQIELDELNDTLKGLNPENKDAKDIKHYDTQRTVKKMEGQKAALESKLKELADIKRDNTINFDELGVDMLFVDESHTYKNLTFSTKMGRIAGLGGGKKVDRSFSMKVKTDYLLERYRGRGVVFLTGTPVTNTIGELYTLFRFVTPELFPSMGIRYFDDWAANFGSVADVSELAPDGQTYTVRQKFTEFTNIAQLTNLFRSYADVKQAADLNLPTPKVRGDGPEHVLAPTTMEVARLMEEILRRAESLKSQGAGHHDNWLKLTGDAKKIALDVRLFDPTLEDDPDSKANLAVSRIFETWKKTGSISGTQLVFADNFRAKAKDTGKLLFHLHRDMRDKLIALGVPAADIAIIQDTKKKNIPALTDAFNDGHVRILLGSTGSMGVGMNLQKRLVALHHLDAPWTPALMAQREGRILRQGNRYAEGPHAIPGFEVGILQYVTEGSYDGYVFQALETKARAIAKIMSGSETRNRVSDAASAVVINFAAAKAIASGNPDVILKSDLERDLGKLTRARQSFYGELRDTRDEIERLKRRSAGEEVAGKVYRHLRELWQSRSLSGGFHAVIDGLVFTDRAEAIEHLSTVPGIRPTYEINGVAVTTSSQIWGRGKDMIVKNFMEIAPVDGMHDELTSDTWGIIPSVEARMGQLPWRIEATDRQIEGNREKVKQLQLLLEKKAFHDDDKIKQLTKELNEVNVRLGADKEEDEIGFGHDDDTDSDASEAEDPDDEDKGYGEFVAPEPVREVAEKVVEALVDAEDQIRVTLAPSKRSNDAKTANLVVRKRASTLNEMSLLANQALWKAWKYWAAKDKEAQYNFMYAIEDPDGPFYQGLSAQEKKMAEIMRRMMDATWTAVQGRSSVRTVIENYFPHLWKDPEKAADLIRRGLFGRLPLLGKKNFLKRRSIATIYEGIHVHGLEPLFDNPVEMVLAQIFQENTFITGHDMIREAEKLGIIGFVSALKKAPTGMARINDPFGTVYAPPNITMKEAYDDILMNGLNDFARSLGIKVYRQAFIGGKRFGWAEEATGSIMTKFAGPETVLTHEIGHQLDYQFGLADILVNDPTTKHELNALADMRFEGMVVPESYKKYVRKRSEKIANLIHAMVHVPEMAERIAPRSVQVIKDLADQNPRLKPLLQIRASLVLGTRDQKVPLAGPVLLGHYMAPEPVAKVFNNYLSPGLAQRQGIGGLAFRTLRGTSNFMNMVQLGISAFHFSFTSLDAGASMASVGVSELLNGQPLTGLKHIALSSAVTAPWISLFEGNKIMKEFYATGSQGAEYAKVIDQLRLAGGRPHEAEFSFHHSAVASFIQAWKGGKSVPAVWRFVPAFFETIAQPLMQWYVPRLKMAAFAQLAHEQLALLGEDAEPIVVRAVLARAWDSIDNRLGQLVYDNLSWERATKDIGQIMVRSLGWNIGSFRELGGAALIDIPLAIAGKGDAYVDTGRGVKKFILPPRVRYLTVMPVYIALHGAILMYLMTGKWPEELLDYFFPKTGAKNLNGTDERIAIPSYSKDVISFGNDALSAVSDMSPKLAFKTVGHKANPLLSMLYSMLQNEDYYGTEIIHRDDPAYRQLVGLTEYAASQFVPISITSMLQHSKSGNFTKGSAVESFFGFGPASRSLTESRAERISAQRLADRMPQGSNTRAEADRGALKSQLVNKLRQNLPGVDAEIDAAVSAHRLRDEDDLAIRTAATHTPLYRMNLGAPIEAFLDAWEAATPVEKDGIRDLLYSKEHLIDGVDFERQDEVRARYDKDVAEDNLPRRTPPPR